MRILVVDDERHSLAVIERLLCAASPHIEGRYASPREALEWIQTEAFDAAFLDIEMSMAVGLSLAEQILKKAPRTEIVFLKPYQQGANAYAAALASGNGIASIARVGRIDQTLQRLSRRGAQGVVHPSVMSLRALGSPQVICRGEPLRWDRRKTGELFWYLVAHADTKVNKARLCEDLWPGLTTERALPNLQVTVSRLRKTLGCVSRADVMILFADDCYTLWLGDVDYDVRRFRELVQEGSVEAFCQAVDLYNGRFLANESWLWAEYERESLRRDLEKAAIGVVRQCLEGDDYAQAETIAEKALQHECLCADLDQLYLKAAAEHTGTRGLTQAYGTLKQLYRQQLDMELSEEANAAYRQLRRK